MLDVGIIGLGPAWEWRYRPALARLRNRIRVRAVYDPVGNRAHTAADQLQAQPCVGLRSLFTRRDVRAVLILDCGWLDYWPLEWALEFDKPAFVAGSFGSDLARLRSLQQRRAEAGLDVMPEFSRRYTPATCRARELIATRMGRVESIEIRARFPLPPERDVVPGQEVQADFLIGLIDWCRYMVGKPIAGIERATENEFRAHFQPGGDQPSATATLRLAADVGTASDWEAVLDCTGGRLMMRDDTGLEWESAGQPGCESLLSERGEVDVMLDHFSRRVVGGLIPLPGLEDVCAALALLGERCL